MLAQPPAVTSTLQGVPPSGFGSTHHPKTSLASGEGLHGAGRPSASPKTSPLPRNAKLWLFRWKDKGVLHFFWGILVENRCPAPHLGMEVWGPAGDQGMVCTDCQT